MATALVMTGIPMTKGFQSKPLPIGLQPNIVTPESVQVASLLPMKKPGMLSAAIEEGLHVEGLIDKVFSHIKPVHRLSEEDAARYQNIFAFQDTSEFARADAEMAKLKDKRLMGHVLFQRYTSKDYVSSYVQLADWMKNYADLPDAQKIYDLAQRKRVKNEQPDLVAPKTARAISAQHDFDVGQLAQPYLASTRMTKQEKDIVGALHAALADRPSVALKKLESDEAKKTFSDTEYDALRALVAESFYYNHKVDTAYQLARESADRSGVEVPKAGWIAGLSAWRQGDYRTAARYFETAAQSKRSSAWMTAASSYWAARSYLRSHQPEKVNVWLYRAAEYPRTFYGIIAMKALGMDQASFNWSLPELKDKHINALSRIPAGKRALALIDAGRPDLASSEIEQVIPSSKDRNLQEALVALTASSGMPGVSYRLASTFRARDGGLYDAALYPDVPWAPEKGFDVDKALVHAFIRQESKFDPSAQNRGSGAQGLMQLMPTTAKHVAKISGDKIDAGALKDPVVNISLGQRYLAELLKADGVDNNLFKLAVAYNAGPGKLARWEKSVAYANDPLLFIESIPAAETRIFVERVLTNYWIYRIKFNQGTESIDKVAEGEWPVYVAQDFSRSGVFADAATYFTR